MSEESAEIRRETVETCADAIEAFHKAECRERDLPIINYRAVLRQAMFPSTPCTDKDGEKPGLVKPAPHTEVVSRMQRLEESLRDVLKSAVPHPVEHPTMWTAWRKAEAMLGISTEHSHTIPTADKALETQLLKASATADSKRRR